MIDMIVAGIIAVINLPISIVSAKKERIVTSYISMILFWSCIGYCIKGLVPW